MPASLFRLILGAVLLIGLSIDCLATTKLRVGTYNIRLQCDGDIPGGNSWVSRKGPLLGLVRFHDFELIGFQEVLRAQLDDLLTNQEYGYVGVGRDDGGNAGEFAPILFRKSRFALLDQGTFWLSDTPESVSYGWDAKKYYRICTWAKLLDAKSGKIIQVWNAHLDHEGVESRRNAARLILARMGVAVKQGCLVILLGDLNAPPDSEAYQIITSVLHDTRNLSQQPPYGPAGTFNAFRYDKPCTERIDYIFVGENVRVLKHGTLSDSYELHFPSDHFPVLTELEY